MKNMILFQTITSIVILFTGCTMENDITKGDMENDCDTTLTDTSTPESQSPCGPSICTYDSFCLNYKLYDSVSKNELTGEWELTAYVDTLDCKIKTKPSDIPKTVTLIFYENGSMSGETVSNTFSGKYRLSDNKISFSEIIMTEITEPEWGRKFSELIYFTRHFTIIENKLIINSKEILIFTKK